MSGFIDVVQLFDQITSRMKVKYVQNKRFRKKYSLQSEFHYTTLLQFNYFSTIYASSTLSLLLSLSHSIASNLCGFNSISVQSFFVESHFEYPITNWLFCLFIIIINCCCFFVIFCCPYSLTCPSTPHIFNLSLLYLGYCLVVCNQFVCVCVRGRGGGDFIEVKWQPRSIMPHLIKYVLLLVGNDTTMNKKKIHLDKYKY